jgi:pimeloyl-ACP methyl ester carboxylesterase
MLVAVGCAAVTPLALGRAQQASALTDPHPCPNAPGFTCSTLVVPLDHDRTDSSGRLRLAVAAQDRRAPRGTLLFLTGGPGQPGVPFAQRIASRLGSAFAGYRLVLLDQRGTGGSALRCPGLQRQMGSTDLAIPTKGAVTACARAIGPRRAFFGTAQTVEDLEALRVALGAQRLTIDGVSYGSFVAERYALRHPEHVDRLVLDSVVPHRRGADPLEVANAHAVGRVLRAACLQASCKTDPVRDLALVVRRRKLGPRLLNALVSMSVVNPGFGGVASALHEARLGRLGPLRALLAGWGPDTGTPAEEFSQGLHASALCADTPMPWGSASAPLASRARALRRAVVRISTRTLWPFDRATAAGNGIVKTCLFWPPIAVPTSQVAANLPAVPTLLLAGDRDLSTPLESARAEAAHAPKGRLVIVRGAGHSVQLRATSSVGRQAVDDFLHQP